MFKLFTVLPPSFNSWIPHPGILETSLQEHQNGGDSLNRSLGAVQRPPTVLLSPGISLFTKMVNHCAMDVISTSAHSTAGFAVPADSHLFWQSKNNFAFCFMKRRSKVDSSLKFPKTACLERCSLTSYSSDTYQDDNSTIFLLQLLLSTS